MTLTASIGYSIFPTDTPERDQLLSNAKLAMHRGKSKQRGSICQYHREMDDGARARRALARDLRTAAERRELELHYQLQTTLSDGRICGAEALMRWRHPKRGMISPAEFIPLAEETEAIFAMGEWALRTACRDAAAGRIPGTVAVNLRRSSSAATISPRPSMGFCWRPACRRRRLEVEVTESTIMSDQTRGLHILRKLKAMGISVAMDDFGTGYSSLATLHAFPVRQDQARPVLRQTAAERRGGGRDRPHRAGARRKPGHAGAGRRHRDRGAMAIPGATPAAPRARAICSQGRWSRAIAGGDHRRRALRARSGIRVHRGGAAGGGRIKKAAGKIDSSVRLLRSAR